jgi:hypothetical protein
MFIELRDLRQSVVLAAVGITGAIAQVLQFPKHGHGGCGCQCLFEFFQGGDLFA